MADITLPDTIQTMFLHRSQHRGITTQRMYDLLSSNDKQWVDETCKLFSLKYLYKCWLVGEKNPHVSFVRCHYCNKLVDYHLVEQMASKDVDAYHYCNNQCRINDIDAIGSKRHKTMIDKYGGPHSARSIEIRNKMRQTCKERYGDEYPFRLPEIREKQQQTMFERYGCNHPSQSQAIQERRKKTIQERYGVDSFSQTDQFKMAVSKPMSEKAKAKRNNTMQTLYGGNAAACDPNVALKISLSKRSAERYHQLSQQLSKKRIAIVSSLEQFLTSQIVTYKCEVCGYTWSTKITNVQNIHCDVCFHKRSQPENELVEFVSKLSTSKILRNERPEFLNKRELDILIPDINVAIEYNGSIWHSDKYIKNPTRHFEKVMDCAKNGIYLYTIFDFVYKTNMSDILYDLNRIINPQSGIKIELKDNKTLCEIDQYGAVLSNSTYYNNEVVIDAFNRQSIQLYIDYYKKLFDGPFYVKLDLSKHFINFFTDYTHVDYNPPNYVWFRGQTAYPQTYKIPEDAVNKFYKIYDCGSATLTYNG